jgi:hypothetical protein
VMEHGGGMPALGTPGSLLSVGWAKKRLFMCQSGLQHFHQDYNKSSLLWFIVGGTKALACSSKMNIVIYVVRVTRA